MDLVDSCRARVFHKLLGSLLSVSHALFNNALLVLGRSELALCEWVRFRVGLSPWPLTAPETTPLRCTKQHIISECASVSHIFSEYATRDLRLSQFQ